MECSEATRSETPNSTYQLSRTDDTGDNHVPLLAALIKYGLDPFTAKCERRYQVIREALNWHKSSFSHFITISYQHKVTHYTAARDINQLLEMIPGNSRSAYCRTFASISLEPTHLRGWVLNGGYLTAIAREERQPVGVPYLLTQWHIHALVGSVRGDLTADAIKRDYLNRNGWNVCVQDFDGSAYLTNYISDPTRGNLFSELQVTNDRNLHEYCMRQSVRLDLRGLTLPEYVS